MPSAQGGLGAAVAPARLDKAAPPRDARRMGDVTRRALGASLPLFAAVAAEGRAAALATPEILAQLAPTGTLRVGINLGNFLLVTGREADGTTPRGVAPSLARAIAERLGVPVRFVTYERPGPMADAVGTGAWDIAFLGNEPQRAERIAFSAPYSEIEATYLVPANSPLARLEDVDREGVRIATPGGAAYTLWLERNIRRATLRPAPSIPAATEMFLAENLEALAGLRPGLLADQARIGGSRLLEGRFMAVQQAIGTARPNAAGAAFLDAFVAEAKATGLVARLIAEHGARGLSVAG